MSMNGFLSLFIRLTVSSCRVYPSVALLVNLMVCRLDGRTAGRVFGSSERPSLCQLNLVSDCRTSFMQGRQVGGSKSIKLILKNYFEMYCTLYLYLCVQMTKAQTQIKIFLMPFYSTPCALATATL